MRNMLDKWEEIYFDALNLDEDFVLRIPIDPLPGEAEEDTAFRYFKQEGILIGDDDDNLFVDFARADEVDSNISKFFEASRQAEFSTTLDQLETDGLIFSSVDEQGNIVYILTDEGKKYVENMQT